MHMPERGRGIGDVNDTLTDADNFLTDETITGVPNWLLLGGSIIAIKLLTATHAGVKKGYRKIKKKVSA